MTTVKSIYMLVLFLSAYFWLFALWFLFFKRNYIIEDASRELQIPKDRLRRYHKQISALVFLAGAGWCGWLVNLVAR